jgi:aspartate-semialdehyde dehydrogenase
MADGLKIGIVGATGAVGQELLSLFDQRSTQISELRLMSGPRSAGSTISFRGEDLTVALAAADQFDGLDVVFFSAGAGVSKSLASAAVDAGALVVDNSSAFRMDEGVPLVIPEINWSVAGEQKIIANPNCSTIILLMAIAPLRSLGKIKRIIASTYQSVSGAGAIAMQELIDQTRVVLDGGEAVPESFGHQCAFNVFSHDSDVDGNGFNVEEQKMFEETRKILEDDEIGLSVTCVRVPVLRAHSEAILVEFEGDAPSVEEARRVLSQADGVRIVDDREANHFPMPIESGGEDDVFVGRIRKDAASSNGLWLFASGDQLRKGAALNALQIAERAFS